jgi:mannose-6-phosphate isomerase-like protein (cupin superfamily)
MATQTSRETLRFWVLGTDMTILANHDDTGGRYDLIEGRPPAGFQTPLHRHTRYDEQFYMLDGEVTIWAGEQKVVLRAGDTFTIPAGTDHLVASTGDGPSHSLVIASPSGFARVIEAAGIPYAGGQPPVISPADLERFKSHATEIGDVLLGPPAALLGQ